MKRIIDILRKVKRKYHSYRFWQYLIKKMEKNIQFEKLSNMSPYINKPGIAFTFDDSYRVSQWAKYGKELFGHYDVKVTFNVNAFHHFENEREHSQEEIDLLLELQAKGHEIAHHGYKHQNADTYSREKGVYKWLDAEIEPLFDWLEKQSHSKTKEKFKKPVTFAFPYAEYNEDNIKALIPKYFKIVRGQLVGDNLTPFKHTGLAPSICIDRNCLQNPKYIKKMMKICKKTGMNLIFMCHSIIPDEICWDEFGWGEDPTGSGKYRISPNTIQYIISEAKKLGMEFYTTAELAGAATFIDRNFENFVRELVSRPNDKWISISKLSLIKELDLRNQNISNLDGIQYFVNLEKLYLAGNNISDFRLLNKLTNLKELDISINLVS
ncbi:polysaccharide deacetylase family protein [Gottfriedia sp. S16(2024)]|uniref:polysaccharide deacetylase family protein n=1 Tax=Gottfriedia sp. S16(2024) TaxID=3162883 RepID=UPI003D1E0104